MTTTNTERWDVRGADLESVENFISEADWDQYWLEKNPIFTRYGMTGIVSSLGASGKASQRRRSKEKQ